MSPASEELADRIRAIVGRRAGVAEKKMFGGLAFLIGGNESISTAISNMLFTLATRPDLAEAALQLLLLATRCRRSRTIAGFAPAARAA